METNEQNREKSKLPVEKTYGEKVHHLVFDTLINFWATLAISGLFVFWAKYSDVPLPKTFFQGKLPRDFHSWTRDRFARLPFLKIFGEHSKVPTIMADALSINLPGTLTILPSAWIGAKVKTRMVGWLDRKHYGADAEDDPRIAERHAIIARELKPTVIGATLARIGTMTAAVAASYAIGAGTKENLISVWGKDNEALSKFPGIDKLSSDAGAITGHSIAEGAPRFSNFVNRQFSKIGVKRDWTKGTEIYRSALEGWLKYTALDVMYTTVTSSTIHPFMRLLSHVPFLSYRTVPVVTYRAKPNAGADLASGSEQRDVVEDPSEKPNDRQPPRAQVSQAKELSTLSANRRSAELGATS